MKTTKSICLTVAIVTGAIVGARAEQFRTDINPAMQYYQAFLVAPDLPQADRDYLFAKEWRWQKVPERFGELVGRYDNQLKLVRQAAQQTVPCDWGIDMSLGPATLLPHLAQVKGIVQATRLRVLWLLQNGRQADARDDLLAAFTLGRNSSRDGTLISALVQIAVENIVYATVAENFYRFSPETLNQLVEGFDAAPPRRTMADCAPTEKLFFLDWLANRIVELQKENRGDEAKVMAGVKELLSYLDVPEEGQANQAPLNRSEQVIKAAGGTSDGVLNLLRDMEPLYQRLAVILALPHGEFEEQAKQFSARIIQSQNPLVSIGFPAFEKARHREFVIMVKLAMVRAAVEHRLHGDAGLQSVTDPCGQGPFTFERFVFNGVDRGFVLRSSYAPAGFPEVLIFTEKDGPPFYMDGQRAGEALSK